MFARRGAQRIASSSAILRILGRQSRSLTVHCNSSVVSRAPSTSSSSTTTRFLSSVPATSAIARPTFATPVSSRLCISNRSRFRSINAIPPRSHNLRAYTTTTTTAPDLPVFEESPLGRGKDRPKCTLKVGDKVHGWEVKKIVPVPDFDFMTYTLEHIKTGAKYFHIDCEDRNNVFAITFLTPPENSSGAPHILEHTTLCGSEKYPVRDPFFNMMKRSLNTYMNAWTSSDHTTYPFSTQNANDFNNLLSVYLDATLFPKLLETDFKQEGHRLEFEEPENPESPLLFKGVVYNEMKGAMGEASQILGEKIGELLYKGSPYQNNSGGNPREIPKLTWEYLRNFHKEHYHPSNAYVYTYGDLPLESHLKFINENGFDKFDRIEPKKIAPLPKRSEPVIAKITGPYDTMSPNPEKQARVSISYLLNEVTDAFETFSINFMTSMMLDIPRGPFYKTLIESGLAPDFVQGSGYDLSVKQCSFTIGAQGIGEEQVPEIVETINTTFKQLAKKGFDESLIATVLHTLELQSKALSPHFGLGISNTFIPVWCHGGAPEEVLFFNKHVERLKKEMKDKNFFPNLVRKYFLDNKHTVQIIMTPDEQYFDKEREFEQKKLTEIQASLKPEDKSKIIKDAIELRQKQEAKQDITCLPTLTIHDIPPHLPEYVKFNVFHNDTIYYNEQKTNGIVYVRVMSRLGNIPSELKFYLPIFAHVLTKLGARSMDHKQLAEKIELYTGGIEASVSILPDIHNPNNFDIALNITSHCLERNTEKMIDLLTAIFNEATFDANPDYLKQVIEQAAMSMAQSIVDSGHVFARMESSKFITRAAFHDEIVGGLTSVAFMNRLPQMDIAEIIAKLKELSHFVLNSNNLRVMVTAEPKAADMAQRITQRFVDAASFVEGIKEPDRSAASFLATPPRNSYIVLPCPVNFVAQSIAATPYMHPDAPILQLTGNLLSSNFLHREIREKGGAYGAGAALTLGGVFNMHSYRDPNVGNTFNVFSRLGEFDSFDQKNVDEAKLETFQQLDSPVGPDGRGLVNFLYGITDEIRLERRSKILYATRAEVLDVMEKHLHALTSNGVAGNKVRMSKAVLGPASEISDEIKNNQDQWTINNAFAGMEAAQQEEEEEN